MTRKKFYSFLLLIILLAAAIRLRGLDNRFLLAADSGRDILVARAAVQLDQLPWVGSFSSAGPFVFGPNWYWFLMLPAIIVPNLFLAPWIAMYSLSLFFILVMGLIGKVAGGRKFGLFLALVAAFSPTAIGLSSYSTHHTMVEIFSALALLGFMAFVQTRRLIFAFLASGAISAAVAMHYQGLYLFLYYPAILLLAPRNIAYFLKLILILTLGFLTSTWPLLLWDGGRGFKNVEQLVYYFREGQYRVWVSNRWLTYLGVFWPAFLGKLFGGSALIGGLLGIFTALVLGFSELRRNSVKILFPALILALQIIILRYQRGERYEGYLNFVHPLVLLLLGWALFQIERWSKVLTWIIVLVLFITSILSAMPVLDWNNDADKLLDARDSLKRVLPNSRFALYGRNLATSNCAYSLALVLDHSDLLDDNGRPLGICLYSLDSCNTPQARELGSFRFQNDLCVLADLKDVSPSTLVRPNHWYPFSILAVYDDVQKWYLREK